jgi:hypothetical protein
MTSRALLFGINYNSSPDSLLRGCINDVRRTAEFLENNAGYDIVQVYTDEYDDHNVTGYSITNKLLRLAVDSCRYKYKQVWIHFSGHGCSSYDYNGDEKDRRDECIVPADYKINGIINDDLIKKIFRYFDKETKVICVFDCCHSGTIGDLHYHYKNNKPTISNNENPCNANIVMISGCDDNQTSADAYNVMNMRQFSGAMTSCLLTILYSNNKITILNLINELQKLLKQKNFTQIPQLTSSYKINNYDCLF